jgi:hypothetical protein
MRMPKYAALIYGEESDPSAVDPEQMQQVMTDYMEFGQNNGDSLAGGEALSSRLETKLKSSV